jgi:hypothetical protein
MLNFKDKLYGSRKGKNQVYFSRIKYGTEYKNSV